MRVTNLDYRPFKALLVKSVLLIQSSIVGSSFPGRRIVNPLGMQPIEAVRLATTEWNLTTRWDSAGTVKCVFGDSCARRKRPSGQSRRAHSPRQLPCFNGSH